MLRMYLWCFLCSIFTEGEIITLLKDNSLTCVATGNDMNATIYLHPPVKNVELKRVNKIKYAYKSTNKDGWNETSKFEGIITDERWEDFPMYNDQLNFTNLRENKKYGFSFCGEGDVEIGISNQQEESSSLSQTNSGTHQAHNANQVCEQWKHYYLRIDNTTKNIRIYTAKGQEHIKEKNTFKSIILKSSKPSLWKLHKLNFRKTVTTIPLTIQVSHSGNLTASLFIHLEKNTNLNISLKSGEKYVGHKYIEEKVNSFKWQKILMEIESHKTSTLNIIPTLEDGSENKAGRQWAVGAINFYPEKIKIYEATVTGNSQTYRCKSVDDSSGVKSHYKRQECPPGYLGSDCKIKCGTIFDNNRYSTCEEHSICYPDQCYCAWGYKGDCKKKCQSGYWSLNCISHCPEKCNQCDPKTGDCEKCSEGYGGDGCKVKLPVLLEAPILEKITENSFVIHVKNLNYGTNEAKPDKYVVQYKEKNEKDFKKYEGPIFPLEHRGIRFDLEILRQKCECKVRILLVINNTFSTVGIPEITIGSLELREITHNSISLSWPNSINELKGSYGIKYDCRQEFCESKNDISKTINDLKGNYIITLLKPYAKCFIHLYYNYHETRRNQEELVDVIKTNTKKLSKITKEIYPSFSCTNQWCNNGITTSSIVKEHYQATERIELDRPLLPFSNYKIEVTAKLLNATMSKTYSIQQTAPAKPNMVKDLSIYCRNSTNLSVKWKSPYPPTGDISSYVIKYGNKKKEVKEFGSGDKFIYTSVPVNVNDISKITVWANHNDIKEPGIPNTIPVRKTAPAVTNLRVKFSPPNNVLLNWAHSFLKEFLINVKGRNYAENVYVISDQCLGNFSKNIQLKDPKENTIQISGSTVDSETASATITTSSLSFSFQPLVQICLNTTICTLSIPKPDDTPKTSNFSIVVKEKLFGKHAWTISNLNFTNENYTDLDIGDQKAISLQDTTFIMYLRDDNNHEYPLFVDETSAVVHIALAGLITLAVIAIIFLSYLGYAYKYKKYPFDLKMPLRKRRTTNWSQEDILQLSPHYKMNSIRTVRSKYEAPANQRELESLIESPSDHSGSDTLTSLPIKVENYENYLMTALGDDPYSNELTKQYKRLQTKINKPCYVGALNNNIKKNRYKNILPYDEARVILKDDEGSDYINASCIDGYENSKAFIATQAPMKSTLGDFWLMIWQANVANIIMLTELKENGTIKCEQYWPDLQQKVRYGEVLIENICVKVFSDYIHRQLSVTSEKQMRLIHHWHYTTWPDHGVPLYPQNFTPFVKRLLAMPQQSAPIVVHCNAGCGRTGTIILCDIVLRMAAKEKKLDFVEKLIAMRQQRTGLVNNVNQYVFAHFVVLECLFGVNFSIPVDDSFQDEIFKVLRKTTVKPLMESLDKVTMQFYKRQVKFASMMADEDKSKNRFSDILPSGPSQIYLPASSESPSNYINAVIVDCYRCPKKIIVTQQPLPNTVEDFWTLIKGLEINTIVSLNEIDKNDSNCPEFWSSADKLTNLQILEEVEENAYTIIKLKVIDKTNKTNEKTVNVIKMKNWKRETPSPPKPKDLIMVYKEMFSTSWKGNSQIVVTCYDGATASGLFVALTYLLEKMNYEQVCDVFSAIRTVRQSREQFVQEWGQMEFLYKAAKIYIEEFDNYANFDN